MSNCFRGFHGARGTTSRFGAPVGAGSGSFRNRSGFGRGLQLATPGLGPFRWEELWRNEMDGMLHPDAMKVQSK